VIAPEVVKIFPELAAAARRRGHMVEFRAWTLLRACNADGSGILFQAQAIATLRKHLGWGEAHATRVLRRGGGKWWHRCTAKYRGGKMLRLISVGKVAIRLETVPGRAALVPLAKLGGHKMFAAACYAAWMAVGKRSSRTISRETLGIVWAATTPTQRDWEREAGIRVRENWVTLPECSPEEEIASGLYPDRDDPAVRVTTLPDGSVVIRRQIPNTYTCKGKMKIVGLGSRMRGVASLCRWYLSTAARNEGDTGDARQARRYFASYSYVKNLKTARRHVRKTDERAFVYALVNDAKGIGQWMAV